jgi:hypothetical protein
VRDNQSEENDNLNKVIHNETELVKIYDQKAHPNLGIYLISRYLLH